MALIKQIKVGGTTYNIGINPVSPLSMSGDNLALKLGSGLQTVDGALDLFLSGYSLTNDNGISVKVSSGLEHTPQGIALMISGENEDYSRGLEFVRGMLSLKLGSGLKFNNAGEIDLA